MFSCCRKKCSCKHWQRKRNAEAWLCRSSRIMLIYDSNAIDTPMAANKQQSALNESDWMRFGCKSIVSCVFLVPCKLFVSIDRLAIDVNVLFQTFFTYLILLYSDITDMWACEPITFQYVCTLYTLYMYPKILHTDYITLLTRKSMSCCEGRHRQCG